MSKNKEKSAKRTIITIGVIVLIIAALGGAVITFITDYLWFKDLGYTTVFLTKLFSIIKLLIPSFVVLTLIVKLYLSFINKDYHKKMECMTFTASEKTISKVGWLISGIVGLISGWMFSTQLWYEFMSFLNKASFDIDDPLFGLDVSTYIYTIPLANRLLKILIVFLILLMVATVVYYAFLMTVRRPKMFNGTKAETQSQPGDDFSGESFQERYAREGEDAFRNASNSANRGYGNSFGKGFGSAFSKFGQGGYGGQQNPFNDAGDAVKNVINEKFTGNWRELLQLAKRQVIIIGIFFFACLAINFFLNQFDLLYHQGSVVYGAGFVDANIYLWANRILCVLAVASAVLFAVGMARKSIKVKLIAVCPALMIAVYILAIIVGLLVQNFIVAPDEINKESQYISNNIAMTQHAYGINNIEEESFAAETALTAEDIAKNDAIFQNIRINDFEPTEQFYNQRQSIKQYYKFNDVDVDRYSVDGDYCQVFLSAREIDESNINSQWITKHLKYTHGYGITLSKVNSITSSGQPDILIQNVPPESQVDEIQITRPEIYFGESTDNYVIVGTDEKEFDYPLGDKNVYNEYEGTSGVNLTPINRLLFAIREHSMKILVSTNISSKSKILFARNIEERVQKIAPYLSYDSDPYLVVNDNGELFWMIDAYTTTSYYPYSEPYSKAGLNYIRNSVKVVVDAYNGDVDFYVVDENDPMVQTMAGVFPGLFKSIDKMPADLYKHIRYPKALFEIQAEMYTKYHMTDVSVFYQGEDQWDIANEVYGQEEVQMDSNYFIMSLPGQTEEEFVLTISYTPTSKNNMTGLLLARCDGDNYGQLKLYRMPKGKTVYGPAQIEAQIDQDPTISKEFSLWSQQGSTYLRGNVFVIPVEDSLLYVEPIYLQSSTSSSLPEVKRVIVVYNDKIAYENTLGEALESMFGTNIGDLNHVGEVDAVGGDAAAVDGAAPAEGTTEDGGSAVLSQSEIIAKANTAYDNAVAAQQSGDWAAYGQYIKELEGYLRSLQ